MNSVTTYASYLVRLWHETSYGQAAGKPIWHAEVESIQSGEWWRFDDPGSLAAFFVARLQQGNREISGRGE